MSRIIFFITALILIVRAEDLEIKSKFFNYDKNVSIFQDDVNVTKGKDNILCNRLGVYMDANRSAKKIIALKNVRFIFSLDNNSTYQGRSNKLEYLVKKDLIFLDGNVSIHKLEEKQMMYGEHVVINKKTKNVEVVGAENRPVKFIIKVKD